MLSVKEYAEKQGVTIQAIYQSLKSKENKDRLKGHIFMKDGKKMLDDVAVEFLDETRKKNPVIILQDTKNEELMDLKDKNEKLTAAIIDLQKQLIQSQTELSNTQKQLLQAKENESLLIASKSEITALNGKIEGLQEELESEKSKSWWDKLLKR